jgi:hypothetical protein
MEGNPQRATSGRLLGFLPNPTLSAKRDRGVGKKEVAIKVRREEREKKKERKEKERKEKTKSKEECCERYKETATRRGKRSLRNS